MANYQVFWKDYCKRVGEENAKKELVRQLRMAAEIIENYDYPDVFSACMLPPGSEDVELVGTVGVTLSYPWPG